MKFNPTQFSFLLAMFESGAVTLNVAMLQRRFNATDLTMLLGLAFEANGLLLTCFDSDDEAVDAVPYQRGKYHFLDGVWHDVDANLLKAYRYRMDWLPKTLKSSLHLSGKIIETIPQCLWLLGYLEQGRTRTPIWLARQLQQADIVDQIYDALDSLTQDRYGVIISEHSISYKRFAFPGKYRIVKPAALLNDEGYLTTLFLELPQPHENQLIHWNEAKGVLTRRGQAPVLFKGTMNRRAISILYDRCFKKRNTINMNVLLEQVGSSSSHINKLFSGHANWREVVGFADGECWLIVPE